MINIETSILLENLVCRQYIQFILASLVKRLTDSIAKQYKMFFCDLMNLQTISIQNVKFANITNYPNLCFASDSIALIVCVKERKKERKLQGFFTLFSGVYSTRMGPIQSIKFYFHVERILIIKLTQ